MACRPPTPPRPTRRSRLMALVPLALAALLAFPALVRADCCQAVTFDPVDNSPQSYTATVAGKSQQFFANNKIYKAVIVFPPNYAMQPPSPAYQPAQANCTRIAVASNNPNAFQCSYASTSPTHPYDFGLTFNIVVPPSATSSSGSTPAAPKLESLTIYGESCISTATNIEKCANPSDPSAPQGIKLTTPIALSFLGTYPLWVVILVGILAAALIVGFIYVVYRNHKGNPESPNSSSPGGRFAPTLPNFAANDRRKAASNRTSFWARATRHVTPPPSSTANADHVALAPRGPPSPPPAMTAMEQKNGEWVFSHQAGGAPRPMTAAEVANLAPVPQPTRETAAGTAVTNITLPTYLNIDENELVSFAGTSTAAAPPPAPAPTLPHVAAPPALVVVDDDDDDATPLHRTMSTAAHHHHHPAAHRANTLRKPPAPAVAAVGGGTNLKRSPSRASSGSHSRTNTPNPAATGGLAPLIQLDMQDMDVPASIRRAPSYRKAERERDRGAAISRAASAAANARRPASPVTVSRAASAGTNIRRAPSTVRSVGAVSTAPAAPTPPPPALPDYFNPIEYEDPSNLAAMGIKPNTPEKDDQIRQWANVISSFKSEAGSDTPSDLGVGADDDDEDEEAPIGVTLRRTASSAQPPAVRAAVGQQRSVHPLRRPVADDDDDGVPLAMTMARHDDDDEEEEEEDHVPLAAMATTLARVPTSSGPRGGAPSVDPRARTATGTSTNAGQSTAAMDDLLDAYLS
ncbi:hypothetical protein GGF32_009820 [Allomyces javanicus]|nr:hypothetical protein GGF32_009820 [Allomyces javanicus]